MDINKISLLFTFLFYHSFLFISKHVLYVIDLSFNKSTFKKNIDFLQNKLITQNVLKNVYATCLVLHVTCLTLISS